jgi:protein-disulfide isomerase
MSRKTLFISGLAIILLAFIVAAVLYQKQELSLLGESTYKNRQALERDGAPVKGPQDAKVTIVEFFDPACETCADFYPLVKKLVDQYPGKVRVMMRYAPLHAGSDQVVKLLEAAHLQGKFWETLEMLFSNQRRWTSGHVAQPMRARGLMNGLAMDHARLDIDMNLPEVARAIQQDVNDGQALKVRATPEFFVNGRPMPSFGYKQLSQLVKEAVEESY